MLTMAVCTQVTVSFGSTSSLVSLPCFMSHASIPAEVRAARGLPDDLVRISAGIEDEADLIRDLEMAMAKACEEVGVSMSGQSVPKRSSGQQHMLSPQGAPMANGKINRFAANNN